MIALGLGASAGWAAQPAIQAKNGAPQAEQTAGAAPSTSAEPHAATSRASLGGDAIALEVGRSLQGLQNAMGALEPGQLHVAKREKQAIAEGQASVGRNLTQAVPALLEAYSREPENLGAAFRLYRDAEAVLGVAQRSVDVIPNRDDEAGGAALRASTQRLQESLQRLGNWIETQGRANYSARQQQRQAAHAAAAAAAAPPATLVIQDANTASSSNPKKAASKAQKKKQKKPAPVIPHGGGGY